MRRLGLVLGLVALLVSSVGAAPASRCGVRKGHHQPDLVVDASAFDVHITMETITADDCQVGTCLPAAGTYRLLRLTTDTRNIGTVDLVLGAPTACPTVFGAQTCYGLSATQPTVFRLWTPTGYDRWVAARDLRQPITGTGNATFLENARAAGELVATGAKHWFCLEDEFCRTCATPARFDCGFQGLSAGGDWYDEYDYGFACQFIDITGLASGDYVLEVHANPDHVLTEGDYTNNAAAAPVTIP